MTRVAITGHRPDSFLVSHYSTYRIRKIVEDSIFILQKQHGDKLILNLGGALGIDQWAGQTCIELGVKYKLYLPFLPRIQSKFWSDKDKEILKNQISKASGLEIIDPSGDYLVYKYQERNKKMVDDADFVVAFWVGKRIGGTFNCMKYAVNKSKLVYNALDTNSFVENKIITIKDLEDGWTPPTMEK